MLKFTYIVRIVCAFASLLFASETGARAQCTHPCGLTINHSNGWTAEEVAPSGSNVWNITLVLPSMVNDRTYEINWNEQEHATRASINRLEIVQPTPTGHNLRVSIGGDAKLDEIKEIVVSRVTSGEGGWVVVNALITGDLGSAYGPSVLDVSTEGGDMGMEGPITCFAHSTDAGIGLLSEQGSLLGDVGIFPPPQTASPGYVAVGGHINQLDFRNGDIGGSGKRLAILADRSVQSVYAKSINARIGGTDTDPGSNDFDSFVRMIGDFQVGVLAPGSGDFDGEIRAEILGKDPPIFSAGPLRFEGEMRGGIWLQEFDNPLSIYMPNASPGLAGTISTSTLVPGQVGDWTAPIQIHATNPIILDGDDAEGYLDPNLTALSLGGGAAGLVPFRRFDRDCFPPAETEPCIFTNMSLRPGPSKPIKIRHYGPVDWVTGEGVPAPYKIERRRIGGCGTNPECWMDMTDCFEFEREANNTVVRLTPQTDYDLPRGYEYRISLQVHANKRVLRSDLPHLEIDDDPEVFDYPPLVFWICDEPGDGDADDDGIVNFADITSVLANMGLSGCPLKGDADRNGVINFADVTNVLANFSMQYACGSGQQGILEHSGDGFTTMDAMEEPTTAASAATAVADALMQMGYTSIQAFTDAIALMSEEARNAEVRRLGQLLGGE